MLFKYHNDTNILPKTVKSLITMHNPFNIITIMRKTLKNDPLPPTPAAVCAVPHINIFWIFPKRNAIPEQ